MNITRDQLSKILHKTSSQRTEELFIIFEDLFSKYEINTINRIAGFFAQCGHESADFNVLTENLHYSALRLTQVFPRIFPNIAAAQPYDNNPEKIANKIYSSRMGNGTEESGDGYRYRGRGAIQLTGHNNYETFAKSINLSITATVAYCETLRGAIESALWFWKINNINKICDNDDIVTMTARINGGQNGIQDRTLRYTDNKRILT